MPSTECLWCLMLPLEEERPFSEEERRELRRQAGRAAALAALGFVLMLLAIVAWVVGLALVGEQAGFPAAAIFVSGFALVGGSCLLGYRQAKRVRLARRDLRHGTVQRFRGRLDAGDGLMLRNAVRRTLGKAGALLTGTEECLEVYGGTGRLLRLNGQPYRGQDLLLARSETASSPSYAAIAAEWLDPVGETDEGEVVHGGHRELSDAEVAEIRRAALTAWWQPLRLPLLIALWPLTQVVVGSVQGTPPLIAVCWLLFIALFIAPRLLRGASMARKLTAAARHGMVAIIRCPAHTVSSSTGAIPIANSGEEVVVEIFPDSDIVWTINSTPAAWRRM